MKFEYDKEVDAAYIYLQFPIKEGEVKKTLELNPDIILDYDKDSKLIGVEILNASKIVKKDILAQAQVV